MKLIMCAFFTLCISSKGLKPMSAEELQNLHIVERQNRIDKTVESIYNAVLIKASRGGYYAYHWHYPDGPWDSQPDSCCRFDEAYSMELKRKLISLFPDSMIIHNWPMSNDIEIMWNNF